MRRPHPGRLCVICRALFVPGPHASTAITCSPECRRERVRRTCRAWYALHRDEHIARCARQKRERKGRRG